jgi:hypothetical protein
MIGPAILEGRFTALLPLKMARSVVILLALMAHH